VKDIASTKPILNMEEPVLRHISMIVIQKMKLSSTVIDSKGDKDKKIRGKYMDIIEAHYRMRHLGEHP
jgi:hypothetical protein